MNLILWLMVGGVIGWTAGIVLRTDRHEGVFLNVAVGILGAALGGGLLAPLFGMATLRQSNFSAPSLLVSFLGAIVLLALVNFNRRGGAR